MQVVVLLGFSQLLACSKLWMVSRLRYVAILSDRTPAVAAAELHAVVLPRCMSAHVSIVSVVLGSVCW